MVKLLYVGLILYAILWLWLLIDCVRRKQFHPVFGSGWGTKAFWLLTFLFFNPLLTIWYFLFGKLANPSASPGRGRTAIIVLPALLVAFFHLYAIGLFGHRLGSSPVSMHRDTTGEMVREGKHTNPGLKWHAGQRQSFDSYNSSFVSTVSDHARFACARIVVFNYSHHPLMASVALTLQKELARLSFVEVTDYYPPEHRPSEGGLAYDVMITLDMTKFEQSRLPLRRSLDAEVVATASTSVPSTSGGYSDSQSPPLFSFNWSSTVNHNSTFTGTESDSSAYQKDADAIARKFAEALNKQFMESRNKYGLLPSLPAEFYGAYHEPEPMSFLEGKQTERIYSARALMLHNKSAWQFVDERDAKTVLGEIRTHLEAKGWKATSNQNLEENLPFIRMTKGTKMLVAARYRADITIAQSKDSDGSKRTPPYVIEYEERLTEEELKMALEKLLTSTADVDVLMMFQRMYCGESKRRFYETIERGQWTSASTYVSLADFYKTQTDNNRGRAALVKAIALLPTEEDKSSLRSQIRKIAKDLGNPKLAEEPTSEETYRDLGFLVLGQQPVEQTVRLDRRALFYAKNDKGELTALTLRMRRSLNGKTNPTHELEYRLADTMSSSYGKIEGGTTNKDWFIQHSAGLDKVHVEFKGQRLDEDRFRISAWFSR